MAPTTTVLDWLRGSARLTGTKEGCAEGDCGACTVVLGRSGNGTLRYEAVNSCLMVVPQLDGAALFTVEGLAEKGGTLHPVQQALVETDGTQCGFCTPGFVMAMFAFQQGGEEPSETRIHDALAGNLCRCTGYRAIVDACRRVEPRSGHDDETKRATVAGLRQLPEAVEYRHGAQVFLAPRSLDALLKARASHPDALLLSGGTDLGLRVSKEREAWPLVISTAAVAELKRVAATGGILEIGAGATYTDALPHLDEHFPAFAALVRRIGSRQIRNLGTFAGNLATASPIGDTLPCLVALAAQVVLRSQKGERILAVEDFITGYRKIALAADEIIAAIRIPLLAPNTHFAAYKLSKRFDQDISTLVAAFALTLANGKVDALRAVYGGMAARPARAAALEAALAGRPWTGQSLADVDMLIARDFSPMSDHRGSAVYRLRAAAALVRRLHLETTEAVPVRLETL